MPILVQVFDFPSDSVLNMYKEFLPFHLARNERGFEVGVDFVVFRTTQMIEDVSITFRVV